MLYIQPTAKVIRRRGPQFRVSSEGLEKPPGFHCKQLNHYITESSRLLNCQALRPFQQY